MSISIQENLRGHEDNVEENLIEAIHATMHPLSSLVHSLRDAENEGVFDLGVVLEVIVNQAMDMQEDLLRYIEKKIGSIDLVYVRPSDSRVHHNIAGVKINKPCPAFIAPFRDVP
ncbi:MAG: hypothetical protein PF442_02820 [Desulfobulbaceae bacterium]|jgi:hypothetical protein|nr:hypothetical protein [Desulfobulbaceae bacterium]